MNDEKRMKIMNERPLLKQIANGAVWLDADKYPDDQFPSEPYADEIEKWLRFIDSQGQFNRFLPRLKKVAPDKRDEALAEIVAAYYISKKGYKIINWEPLGQNHRTGEFIIKTLFGQEIFCEVKSPGWEADIFRKEGENSQRLKEKKYKSGESGTYGNYKRIREAICKAYNQIPDDKPTLLILVPDLMVSPFEEIGHPGVDPCENALYREREGYIADCTNKEYEKGDGYFTGDKYENLGALAALRCTFASSEIIYQFVLYRNPYANKLTRLPWHCFFGDNLKTFCRRLFMNLKIYYWRLRGPKRLRPRSKELRRKLKI